MKRIKFARSNMVAGLCAIAMLGLTLPTAQAYDDEDAWMGFNGGDLDSVDQWKPPVDRAASRAYEMHPERGFPTLSKQNISPTKNAIKRYARIVQRGGWPRLPKNRKFRTGDTGDMIARLRRRLEISGDLRPGVGYSTVFDSYVERAVKRYQKRNGLTPTGYVDKRTIMAMNVPASARLLQLRTNIDRLRSQSAKIPQKFVFVNIPSAQIEAIEDGAVVTRHAGVVGKLDRQTPILRSHVEKISFNPYWTVPPTVLRKDLIPKAREYARRGKDIVAEYHFEVFSGGKKLDPKTIDWFSDDVYKYVYRQEPWEENSMGFVKIRFPNKHAVFLHDTPSKHVFGQNFRAESSGCVRVQNVQQLVAWILQDGKDKRGWTRERVAEIKRSKEQLETKPNKTIPVYLAYFTAWATPDGIINFRRDIYNRDSVSASASAY